MMVVFLFLPSEAHQQLPKFSSKALRLERAPPTGETHRLTNMYICAPVEFLKKEKTEEVSNSPSGFIHTFVILVSALDPSIGLLVHAPVFILTACDWPLSLKSFESLKGLCHALVRTRIASVP